MQRIAVGFGTRFLLNCFFITRLRFVWKTHVEQGQKHVHDEVQHHLWNNIDQILRGVVIALMFCVGCDLF